MRAQEATGGLVRVGEGAVGGQFQKRVSRFHCLVNGTAWPALSCQFGTMFTEPAAPHSLQTRRGPSSTKVGLEAGCPIGHRPCGGRTCRPNIGCCRLRDRPRSIPPGRRVGICLSIEVVAAKSSEVFRARRRTQIFNRLGIGRAQSTSARDCAPGDLPSLGEFCLRLYESHRTRRMLCRLNS